MLLGGVERKRSAVIDLRRTGVEQVITLELYVLCESLPTNKKNMTHEPVGKHAVNVPSIESVPVSARHTRHHLHLHPSHGHSFCPTISVTASGVSKSFLSTERQLPSTRLGRFM